VARFCYCFDLAARGEFWQAEYEKIRVEAQREGCMLETCVYATPWFKLLARSQKEDGFPYYCLETEDFVSIVALDDAGRLLLVKQFRPAIGQEALELPGGHVDAGQTPQQAAAQELWEETGYRAGEMELLGCLRPDVGRLTNRLWCFWATELALDPQKQPEPGHEVVLYAGQMSRLLEFGVDNCYSLASVWLAGVKGKLKT
jgi:ADP-ribose pyrophosphatase YjhB (NUDIX family)